MSTTPTGLLSTPLSSIQNLIANSATFQTWTSSVNAAAALARVHLVGVPLPSGTTSLAPADWLTLWPFCVINFDMHHGVHGDVVADGQVRDQSRIGVVFEDGIALVDASNYNESTYKFLNNMGGVIDDVMNTSAQSGQAVITAYDIPHPILRANETDKVAKGDFLQCGVVFHGGLR